MGNKFEIYVWGWFSPDDPEFTYKQVWRGESALQAFFQLRKYKKAGFKCVKLEWR